MNTNDAERIAELEAELIAEREKRVNSDNAQLDEVRRNARLQQSLDAAVEALRWLDEFVVEPEYFPGDGDRQWWREKRDALAKLSKCA